MSDAEALPLARKKLDEGAIYVGPGARKPAAPGMYGRGGSGDCCFSVWDL